MQQIPSLKTNSGFTLIEAIVSLALLAVLSVMSYQAIEVVIGVDERSRNDLADEAQLQRAWQIIGRDLMHLRPRRFSDGLGSVEPAYVTDLSNFGVRFSRGGGPMVRSNPSGVRRIDYKLNQEQQLIRTSWAITESPRQSDGTVLTLLDNVSKVEFNHLAKSGNYSLDWPPINVNLSPYALPRMISVTITAENGFETSRLFAGVVSD
ncbi:MAG: type II secretion system minor pseudopilin GspJ [Porticoccaceae bacterium]|nr:type II secretion system minor pseudopilin GspJ [Porticoccaceae bacterium]|tara:strand:- start:1116 stop:1736 length:621 start_codon:yes stop_codon:yes gene_type:complete